MNSIEITGVDRVIARLGHVKGIEYLRGPMTRSVALLHQQMAVYPNRPQRLPGYIRGRGLANAAGIVYANTSEHLGQRWTTSVVHSIGELIGKVGNNASYARLVQSAIDQAWMHTPYWKNTDDAVMKKSRAQIVQFFQQAIREVINR